MSVLYLFSDIAQAERSVDICVDVDASLSWWSANEFLKISQVMGVGGSFWRRRCKRSGSGSSHTRSKGWLMTAVVVYISPFVALSLRRAPRWQLLFQLVMYTESIRRFLRASDQDPGPCVLCSLLSHLNAGDEPVGGFSNTRTRKRNKTGGQMKCHAVTQRTH